MKQLNHETGETLEGTWDSNCGADFDKNAFGGVDVNLELPSLVDRGVEECQKALVRDIWSGIADVAVHLAHDTDMLVTIEERVLLVTLLTWSAATMGSLVSLETRIGQNYNQSLCVLVRAGDWDMLLSNELWERWGR
jgi:hypothetical protein